MRVVFAGTPAFSVGCLTALLQADDIDVLGVVSQPDRKSGRGLKLTPSPVKKAAVQAGIDVITPETLKNDDEALFWLQEKQADILVVVAFGMILPKAWLDAPAIAPVNVHASLLPRWRGAAPIERALLAGDEQTGVCIMHMEEGLDTGGVYSCEKININEHTTGQALWSGLADMGAKLLLQTLPKIASGELVAQPQDDEQATYASKLRNEERIINWQRSAVEIDRLVRCFSPKPGARTMYRGKWLKIIQGDVLAVKSSQAAGTLVANKHLDIACADGSVYRALQVQPEGKKVMEADAFLRGAQLYEGDLLAGGES